MTASILTQDELKTQLHYDPETGIFTRKLELGRRVKVGDVAGTIDTSTGYSRINVNGKIWYAHRLAWLYMTGEMPINQVDHINSNRYDNRLVNLRLATHEENQKNRIKSKNNTSGYKGVTWDVNRNKWMARAMVNRKTYHLGRYDDAEEAYKAYKAFAKLSHGKFYRG